MVNKIANQNENFFDIFLYKIIDSHIDIYHKLQFTPNIITTFALITGYLSAYFITREQFTTAGLLYLLSYYFDCVDGKFARKYNMVSVFGDYYDHFSDITKFILILIALYINNKLKFKKYILIIIILSILMCYHLGCQQTLYNNRVAESPTLDILKASNESCTKNIHHTKYFGCGTFNLIFTLILIFWNKNI